MQPLIRLTDYVNEYKNLTYDYYAKAHNMILATYYQLDLNLTIFDENYVATYHKTGNLSGRIYNCVHGLPVLFSQQVVPTLDGSEHGVNYASNTITAVVIDPTTGVVPRPEDILLFNLEGDYSTWEVNNVELSGTLERPYYRCLLKQTRTRVNFANQVGANYMYVEYTHHVHSFDDATNFMHLMTRLDQVVHKLNNSARYNHNLAYHHVNKHCFPELETILNSINSLAVPGLITMTHTYGVGLPTSSILTLFCVPSLYDTNADYIDLFEESAEVINQRVHVYTQNKELITTSEGSYDIKTLMSYDSTLFYQCADALKAYLITGPETDEEGEPIDPMPITDDSSVLEKLTHEWFGTLTGDTSYIYESSIATTLLEMAMEYSIVSCKLIALQTKDAVRLV